MQAKATSYLSFRATSSRRIPPTCSEAAYHLWNDGEAALDRFAESETRLKHCLVLPAEHSAFRNAPNSC